MDSVVYATQTALQASRITEDLILPPILEKRAPTVYGCSQNRPEKSEQADKWSKFVH